MGDRAVIIVTLAAAIAVSLIDCSPEAESPERQPAELVDSLIKERAAEDQRAREETAAFTARTQEAFDKEERDPDWAADFEQQLASSYASDTTLPRDALKKVECRTSRCVLDFSFSSARDPIQAHLATLAWLSGSQSCGYYAEEPAEDLLAGQSDQRVYIDCER